MKRYRPIVTILKERKGVPTVIHVSGKRYVLQHEDSARGGVKRTERRKLGVRKQK